MLVAGPQPAHADAATPDGWRFFTRTHLEGYSPSVPVYGTFHDLEQPKHAMLQRERSLDGAGEDPK